eukprot:12921331-Prorocentrum_lima.AAC.1
MPHPAQSKTPAPLQVNSLTACAYAAPTARLPHRGTVQGRASAAPRARDGSSRPPPPASGPLPPASVPRTRPPPAPPQASG